MTLFHGLIVKVRVIKEISKCDVIYRIPNPPVKKIIFWIVTKTIYKTKSI